MGLRTFLAFDIDASAQRALAAAGRQLAPLAGKIRRVETGNLHVTLHFLGDLDAPVLADVCDVAADVAAGCDPFEFTLRGLNVMPSASSGSGRAGRRVRMVWGNVEDPTGQMASVHESLGRGLAGLNLRVENRRFRPHVTLMRIKFCPDAAPLRQAAEALADIEIATCTADEVTVYTSELTRDGPVHTPAARCPLGR